MLCIGGPLDGKWNDEYGDRPYFHVRVDKPFDFSKPFSLTSAIGETVAYKRERFNFPGVVAEFWMLEGMTLAEVMARLFLAYKPPDPLEKGVAGPAR